MCAARLPEIADIKVHRKVFVSPYRRTLRSACELFKNYPSKEELTLVVDPACMEHIGCKNTLLLHNTALKRHCA